jgi:hypothetical protein
MRGNGGKGSPLNSKQHLLVLLIPKYAEKKEFRHTHPLLEQAPKQSEPHSVRLHVLITYMFIMMKLQD